MEKRQKFEKNNFLYSQIIVKLLFMFCEFFLTCGYHTALSRVMQKMNSPVTMQTF